MRVNGLTRGAAEAMPKAQIVAGHSQRMSAADADFDRFYRGSYRKVYASALTMTTEPESARDAAQEAFVRAYARWKRLRSESWAEGWVLTTAMNLARRHRRSALRERLGLRSGRAFSERGLTTDRMEVLESLRRLPKRQRQAIVLFYIGDLPVSAVARVMELSEGAVKSHLSQARQTLRREMEVMNG